MPCTPIFLDTTHSVSSCLITKYTSSPILQYYCSVLSNLACWSHCRQVHQSLWCLMMRYRSISLTHFSASSYSTIQAGHIMVRCPIFTYAPISLIHSYHVLILSCPCWLHRSQVSHLDICTYLTRSLLSRPHTQLPMLVTSWSGVPS